MIVLCIIIDYDNNDNDNAYKTFLVVVPARRIIMMVFVMKFN